MYNKESLNDSPVTLDHLGTSVVNTINSKFKFRQQKNKVIHLSWRIKYDEKVSCSHHAPVGKRTNFMGDPEFPRNFPGWIGRLWIVYSTRPIGMNSDPLSFVNIHSGTGGYGNYRNPNFTAIHPGSQYPCSWDLKIFEEDWGAMKVNNRLIGVFPKEHEFVYTLNESE